MDKEITPNRVLRKLGEKETIKSFNCGDADLNDFLFNEAPLFAEALLAITYIFEDKEKVLAYFSLANDRISIPYRRCLSGCYSFLHKKWLYPFGNRG